MYLLICSRLPRWPCGKESACQCRRRKLDPWVRKIFWRMKWQPTPVFLPGESLGQRSLVGYSPCGCKRVGHNLLNQCTQSTPKAVSEWLTPVKNKSQVVLVVKNPLTNGGNIRDTGLIPGWRDPWRKAGQPTPVVFPGESHGQKSLAGYSP